MIFKMKIFFVLCAFAPLLSNAFLYFKPDAVALSNYQKTKGFNFLESKSLRSSGKSPESFYFVNESPATWEEATELCKQTIADNATLVSFETPEELAKIKSAIASSTKSFWTNGLYETCRKTFVWGWGESLGDWVPWENDLVPPEDDEDEYRVVMVKNNNDWKIRTTKKTERHSFICEVNMTGPIEQLPCQRSFDMIILLDSSTINATSKLDFEYAKSEFVKTMTSNWKQWNHTRVAYFTFADSFIQEFGFNTTHDDFERGDIIDKSTLKSAVKPNVQLALTQSDEYFRKENSGNNERRILLIYSGVTDNENSAKTTAQTLKDKGIQIFVVTRNDNDKHQSLLADLCTKGKMYMKNEYAKLNNELKPFM